MPTPSPGASPSSARRLAAALAAILALAGCSSISPAEPAASDAPAPPALDRKPARPPRVALGGFQRTRLVPIRATSSWWPSVGVGVGAGVGRGRGFGGAGALVPLGPRTTLEAVAQDDNSLLVEFRRMAEASGAFSEIRKMEDAKEDPPVDFRIEGEFSSDSSWHLASYFLHIPYFLTAGVPLLLGAPLTLDITGETRLSVFTAKGAYLGEVRERAAFRVWFSIYRGDTDNEARWMAFIESSRRALAAFLEKHAPATPLPADGEPPAPEGAAASPPG